MSSYTNVPQSSQGNRLSQENLSQSSHITVNSPASSPEIQTPAIDQANRYQNLQPRQPRTMPWISLNRSQLNDGTPRVDTTAPQPVWDRARRELRLGNKLIKRFKWPAENQERVLDAFEDNGWPTHISDPLEAHDSICPKRRLHDTIKCLNRKQINGLIKFRGDGTGLGVLLQIVNEGE
ncbi:MAG: hypothetical protein GY880_19175 [Planctomycetaceae bacterium]|nr:hypothetical protein [Planctomycetaceae bacterium]MCP4478575.1 hypothetical protein [Planctomycetaceae bacterium]MCP4776353.1 hypothetical protein [Planctomycetaceae bacterium]